ncbi:MAG: 2-hydroxyacid dehydrogenase [Proteobacteria bacterium]|nr:2-hydroxyacid dehydrogenase [Pseudomonadota bacterium]MBU2572845.1 2-hydroxyacid dehydrogenase [Elusimicrobiota bacterium]
MKIAFFDAKPYDIESFEKAPDNSGFKITYFKSHLTPETASLAQGFQVVCVFVNDVINKDVIEILDRNGVALIAVRAAGYNNIDLKTIFKRIHVVRVPAYSPYAVAEHAVALMLALNRKVHRAYYRTRDNNFTLNGLLGFDMHGKTAGIIGAGKIGKVAIGILKGFGMKVLAYDAFPDKEYQKNGGVEYVDLDTLYHESDIISLHCPLTKETSHLINETTLAKMKPGVMLINTGRGMLIDSKALIEGLKTGHVGFAGLDVYEEESDYFFEDFSNKVIADDVLARLLSFNNVVVTSHQGFFTREALRNIAAVTLENIRGFFTEQKLPNEICYHCGVNPCQRKTTGKCFKKRKVHV